MHNKRQFELITKKLKVPAKREEHNERQLKSQSERLRLKDSAKRVKRVEHNERQLKSQSERLKDSAKREEHNERQLKSQSKRMKDSC